MPESTEDKADTSEMSPEEIEKAGEAEAGRKESDRSLSIVCPFCKNKFTAHVSPEEMVLLCPKCGKRFNAATALDTGEWESLAESAGWSHVILTSSGKAVPSHIGRYSILDEVGVGAIGTIYRARDPRLGRIVALKVIRSQGESDKKIAARFMSESSTAAKLAHPNIVPIYEIGEHNGRLFFTMEYIEGKTLRELLSKAKRERKHDRAHRGLGRQQALEMLVKIADAIDYAHGQGVIHRDMKPENIIIDSRGDPRITDFGLARAVRPEGLKARKKLIVGTPAYMSPEQASGEPEAVDERTDVYSLGAILYEILTRHRPFEGHDPIEIIRKVRSSDPPRPRSIRHTIDKDLEAICLKAMERNTGERYRTAGALAEELRRFLRNEPILARRAGFLHKFRKLARRREHAFVIAGIVVVALLVLLWGYSRMRLRESELMALTLPEWGYPIVSESFESLESAGAVVGEHSPAWALADGAFVCTDARNETFLFPNTVGTNARLEISARVLDDGFGRNASFSVLLNTYPGGEKADDYCFTCGTSNAGGLRIERQGTTLRKNAAWSLEPNRTYRIRAERVGGSLSLYVNDRATPVLACRDFFPISGGEALNVGLAANGCTVRFVDVQIYSGGTPERLPATALPDEFYMRGYTDDALDLYQAISDMHPGKVLGLEARFKAGRCLLDLDRASEASSVFGMLSAELGKEELGSVEGEGDVGSSDRAIRGEILLASRLGHARALTAMELLQGAFDAARALEGEFEKAKALVELSAFYREFVPAAEAADNYELQLDALNAIVRVEKNDPRERAAALASLADARLTREGPSVGLAETYVKAAETHPASAAARLVSAAETFLQMGIYGRAVAVASPRAAFGDAAATAELRVLRARSLRLTGRNTEAIAVLEGMPTEENADALGELACALILKGKTDEARNVLDDVTLIWANEAPDRLAELHLRLAFACGDLISAESELGRRGIASSVGMERLDIWRGTFMFAQGRFNEAVTSFAGAGRNYRDAGKSRQAAMAYFLAGVAELYGSRPEDARFSFLSAHEESGWARLAGGLLVGKIRYKGLKSLARDSDGFAFYVQFARGLSLLRENLGKAAEELKTADELGRNELSPLSFVAEFAARFAAERARSAAEELPAAEEPEEKAPETDADAAPPVENAPNQPPPEAPEEKAPEAEADVAPPVEDVPDQPQPEAEADVAPPVEDVPDQALPEVSEEDVLRADADFVPPVENAPDQPQPEVPEEEAP